MTEKKICLSEICFYIALLCFMGTKAVGLSETQWPFVVAIAIGIVFSLIKVFLTPFNSTEWILNILLLFMGTVIYFRNSHLEVLMAVLFVIGMKNVAVSRAMKVSLFIWGPLFCFTIIRALFGIKPGFIGTQMKVGMDSGVIRYSLGFTHPNVLHITFFIIVLLVLYVTKPQGKKLIWVSLFFLMMNGYVFLYSLSYTGFIVVILALLAYMLFAFGGRINKATVIAIITVCIMCFILPIVGQYILPEPISNLINRAINQRLSLTGEAFIKVPPTLLGSTKELPVSSLDSSYAYLLYYHGVIPFILFLFGILCTIWFAYKKRKYTEIVVLLVMVISGITEQYMGNLSFKNISLLLIGGTMYEDLIPNIHLKMGRSMEGRCSRFDREFSLNKLESFIERSKKRFSKVSWCKCIIPATVIVLIGNLIFGVLYHEPEKVYQVVDERWGDIEYITYHEEDSWVKSDDILVIGELQDGCRISQISWIDTSYEVIRGRISVSLWCFIFGAFATILVRNETNRKKKND